MIIGLSCSKFHYSNKKEHAYLFSVDEENLKTKKWGNLEFSHRLDTQDFIIADNLLVVLHHTAFKEKEKRHCNIEIYPAYFDCKLSPNFRDPKALPNDQELNYPTCLAFSDTVLAVGVAGLNFQSKIYLYDIKNLNDIKLLGMINLKGSRPCPPSTMSFYKNLLIVVSFLSHKISIYDWKNNFKLINQIDDTNLINPLGLCNYDGKFLISSNFSGDCYCLNEEILEKVNIFPNRFENPWGLYYCDEGFLYTANLGVNGTMKPFLGVFEETKNNNNTINFTVKNNRFSNHAIIQLRYTKI